MPSFYAFMDKDLCLKDKDKVTRIAYILEAGFEYFMSLFVTGTMLGYLLDTLGLSDALQGIISTVATFTCGAQLFALMLVGRKRKWIVTGGHLINQSCFVLLYLLPIFDLPPAVKTALVLVLLFTGHIISNAVSPVKVTWMMGSVQDKNRGRFTALKEMISLAGGICAERTEVFMRCVSTSKSPMRSISSPKSSILSANAPP